MKIKYVLFSLFVIACGSFTPPDEECTSDFDCKGDRVCELGECVSIDDPGEGASDPGEEIEYPCDSVNIPCNCNYTSAYEGMIASAPICEGGQHIYLTCGYCNGGGYAWYTQCYCGY